MIRLSLIVTILVALCQAQTWQPVEFSREITHVQPMTGLVLWPDEARGRDAWFAIDNERASVSLKGLLPGDELQIEIPAAPNADASNIRIVSDYILPNQTIEFEK